MWSSQACELEVEVSALLDGELDLAETLSVVDHLDGCPTCKKFYRAARSLENHLEASRCSATATALVDAARTKPEGLPAIPTPRRWLQAFRPSGWTWSAATVVAVLFAAFFAQSVLRSDDPTEAEEFTNVMLESEPDRMDDARFREMVADLLRSDRKYHRAMLQALHDVEPLAYIPEGSAELPRSSRLQ